MYYKNKNYYGWENSPKLFYALAVISFVLFIVSTIINFSKDLKSEKIPATVHHHDYSYTRTSKGRTKQIDRIYVSYTYNGVQYDSVYVPNVFSPHRYPTGSVMTVKIDPSNPEHCFVEASVISFPLYCGVFCLIMLIMGVFFSSNKNIELDDDDTPPPLEDDQFGYFYEKR